MTEPVRRNLLAGLERVRTGAPEPVDAAIQAVAERHGFAASDLDAQAAPAAPVAEAAAAAPRRVRKLLGRTQQFNVRLRPDTLEEIYAEANGRDIPIAQVVEEAIAALRALRERR